MARKQAELPGTEPARIEEIEQAAELYVDARDKRMRLTEKEVAAKTNLLQVLLAHESELQVGEEGTRVYRYDDEIVVLKPGKRGVKVKAVHDDDDDDKDED